MTARFLVANPCQDACGIRKTSERVEGAPVYECPGCDSRWYELEERRDEKQPPHTSLKDRLGRLRRH